MMNASQSSRTRATRQHPHQHRVAHHPSPNDLVTVTLPRHQLPILNQLKRCHRLSDFSSYAIPDSHWASVNYMLGVGMVIFQPSTGKLVLCYEKKKKYWFLPRGRKDLGETLEQAALREAYEESGYRATFLPLYKGTNQPSPPTPPSHPSLRSFPDTEPIMITTMSWPPHIDPQGKKTDTGGEYLIFWYAGQIPDGAVREEGTGMPDEEDYTSFLVGYDDVVGKVEEGVMDKSEGRVVEFAVRLVEYNREVERAMERQRRRVVREGGQHGDGAGGNEVNAGEDVENGQLGTANAYETTSAATTSVNDTPATITPTPTPTPIMPSTSTSTSTSTSPSTSTSTPISTSTTTSAPRLRSAQGVMNTLYAAATSRSWKRNTIGASGSSNAGGTGDASNEGNSNRNLSGGGNGNGNGNGKGKGKEKGLFFM